MVAYNFQAQFVPAVESGKKAQTIRAIRKGGRHAKEGERIQLYSAMRTKACRKLGDAICTLSTYCAIREDGVTLGNHTPIDLDQFAKDDGFFDFAHMKQWFRDTHGLPFYGRLIKWRLEE